MFGKQRKALLEIRENYSWISSYSEIDPLASECTQILVWHTMTAAPVAAEYARPNPDDEDSANVHKLLEEMIRTGVASGYEKV